MSRPLTKFERAHLMDTGEISLFPRTRLRAMGRCVRCAWYPPTQGHHPDCPSYVELCTCEPQTPGKVAGRWIRSGEPVVEGGGS